MNDQDSQPTISLCSANPKAPFSSDLSTVWSRGHFTDAAVAFLTKGGVEFFRQHCLSCQDCARCRLCFTVQWPTDLDAVALLSPQLGSNLRIHLGTQTPVELGTDLTRLLHSKVVYTDNGNGKCTAFVGSHNWTGNALNGVNLEASVRIECEIVSSIAANIRTHLDLCAQQCFPFDLSNLSYYKAIQRILSSSRPPAPESEEVPFFEAIRGAPAVIIHAEGDEQRFRTNKLMLFLPVKQQKMAKWFSTTTPTTIILFLYPRSTLFGRTPPASRPLLFSGPVGMNNDVNVSPSLQTEVTCEIRDFTKPELVAVPNANIPPIDKESYQVVAELRCNGPAEVPIYHRGKQPMLEIGVHFEHQNNVAEVRSGDEDEALELVGHYGPESMQDGVLLFTEPSPERQIHLDVPEQWLYSPDVQELVRQRLSRKLPQDGFRVALRPSNRKNAYVYRASFALY